MGPIQIFLFGFEDFEATGSIAAELGALSDAGTIRIITARFLLKESSDSLVAMRVSDLTDHEREDLRAAAAALIGMGAGAVIAGDDGAVAGALLGADAALGVGDIGLTDAEILAIGDEMEVGDALLLLVIENVWAEGLRDALRVSGVTFMQQDYLTPEGLVQLGALMGIDAVLEG